MNVGINHTFGTLNPISWLPAIKYDLIIGSDIFSVICTGLLVFMQILSSSHRLTFLSELVVLPKTKQTNTHFLYSIQIRDTSQWTEDMFPWKQTDITPMIVTLISSLNISHSGGFYCRRRLHVRTMGTGLGLIELHHRVKLLELRS